MKTRRYSLKEAAETALRFNIKSRTSGDTTVYYLPGGPIRVVDRGHRHQLAPAALALHLNRLEGNLNPDPPPTPAPAPKKAAPKRPLEPIDHARRLTELAGHYVYETPEKWVFQEKGSGYTCYTRKCHLPNLSAAVERFLHTCVIPAVSTGHLVDPRPHLTQPLLDATSHSIISSVALTAGAVAAPPCGTSTPRSRLLAAIHSLRR